MTFLSLLISFVKGTYGFGAQILREDLETLLQQELDPLQSQHLQEEPTRNKQVLQISIQQQSRLMELYGLGVILLLEDLEMHLELEILQLIDVLQSPPLPVGPTGNK